MSHSFHLLSFLCAYGPAGFIHVSPEELTRRKGFFFAALDWSRVFHSWDSATWNNQARRFILNTEGSR